MSGRMIRTEAGCREGNPHLCPQGSPLALKETLVPWILSLPCPHCKEWIEDQALELHVILSHPGERIPERPAPTRRWWEHVLRGPRHRT